MGLRITARALLLGSAALALTMGQGGALAQQATQDNAQMGTSGKEPVSTKAASGKTTRLDQITVVSRTGESAVQTLASVSHVDEEQIERRMSSSPNDLLFGVPGAMMQTDSQRVGSSVNIRGLQDFGRVAVLTDGARQNFQISGHGTQSLVFIDPMLVKQVDVIRGPVANTYGSGAIGGVVMIETKDAEDFLHSDENWATSLRGQYETNGQGWTTSATGAYRFSDAFSVLGNIVYRDYDHYKDGGGDTIDGSAFDVLSGSLKATIHPTENSKLKLGWVGAKDDWNSPRDIQGFDLKQNTYTARYNLKDEQEKWIDLNINLSYNRTFLGQTYLKAPDYKVFDPTTGSLIYDPAIGDTSNLPLGEQTTYKLGTLGLDVWNTSRFETGQFAHELTYGGDWVSDDVVTKDPSGSQDTYTPSGKRRVSGVYVQDKLTWDWLEIIGGLRYDNYKLESDTEGSSGSRLSPRITVGVSPFQDSVLDGLQVYGTYAEGYRSPSITETLMNGLHPAGLPFPFLPNPGLKPETAKTWEAGLNYKRDGVFRGDDALRLKAAYFHNDIDDYISQSTVFPPTGGCSYFFCVQYQNYANAEIQGVELEGMYDAAWGYFGLSASFIKGHTVSYDGVREDLTTVPSSQVTGQLGLRFLEDKLLLGGEVQYNGKPRGNDFAKDYTLVNAFASYRVNDNFKFDFRIDNIFNEKYFNALNTEYNDAGVAVGTVAYEPGVTFRLAATMRWGG